MVKNIEPKLRKIGNYLKLEDDALFCIPEYQRPYTWGVEHCDKLVANGLICNDLLSSIK